MPVRQKEVDRWLGRGRGGQHHVGEGVWPNPQPVAVPELSQDVGEAHDPRREILVGV